MIYWISEEDRAPNAPETRDIARRIAICRGWIAVALTALPAIVQRFW